ncbi:hypothetical protein AALO_G00294190 [Alosa alosa]|uniref:Uncharacterized protein n=1 Tax=Alosa alosa TaxID=278164 RepID=A0AAV6FDK2_9TELE|nr:hypothetical protein AALO_G00294190 [Alosa alosa]
MDQARCIAEELNRGSYSTLWEYFCDKPGASGYPHGDLTPESEDECTDDESDFIKLENIPNLQLTLADDEDEDSNDKLSPELMYKIRSDSIAAETEWQNMRIIGHLEANRHTVVTLEMTTSTKKPQMKRKSSRTTYFIGGNEVCRNTFQFLVA